MIRISVLIGIQNPAYRPVFYFIIMFKRYKKTLKEEGWKGLVEKEGWKIVLLLFLFFLIKGLFWLGLAYFAVKKAV